MSRPILFPLTLAGLLAVGSGAALAQDTQPKAPPTTLVTPPSNGTPVVSTPAAKTPPVTAPLPVGTRVAGVERAARPEPDAGHAAGHGQPLDYWSMVFVFMLATFIGIGVIRRVSRLLHTPLMSLTNAISAIAVVGAIIVTAGEPYPVWIRVLGGLALFCSMTNIVSGFLITDRMLKMFKTREGGQA